MADSDKELAGHELDALVAEHVMGWQQLKTVSLHGKQQTVFIDEQGGSHTIECGCVEDFNPSTDIAATMEVVAHLAALGYQWQFRSTAEHKSFHDNKPHVQFWHYKEGVLQPIIWATADSLPEAICRAALAAVESIKGEPG